MHLNNKLKSMWSTITTDPNKCLLWRLMSNLSQLYYSESKFEKKYNTKLSSWSCQPQRITSWFLFTRNYKNHEMPNLTLLNSENFFLKMKLSQDYWTTLRKYLSFPFLLVNALSVPFFLAIPVLVDTQECSYRSRTQWMSCIGSSLQGFQLKPFWLRMHSVSLHL